MKTDKEFDELMDNELHLAVRVSDLEGTKTALEQGLDPNKIGLFEWSALHEAAHNGDYKNMKILMKYGGDCNRKDLLAGSTSLHYAASEGHPKCLDILLSNGADVSISNDKGQTALDITRHKGCKEVFSKYGFDVKTSVHFEDQTHKNVNKNSKYTSKYLSKNCQNLKANHPPSSVSKNVCKTSLSDESNESGIGSKTSLTDSASMSSGFSKSHSPNLLRGDSRSFTSDNTSSPCKSYSSFGSLTSIGSSIISGNDDCAGYVTMAFQYNSKTSNLKIRIVEIVLTCLLPIQKPRKDTGLLLYVSGTIENPNEVNIEKESTWLKSKSETFKLYPDGDQLNPRIEHDRSVETFWNHRTAHVKFKSSLAVEFTGVTKNHVQDNLIKISICSRHKKNLLKSFVQNSAIATTELTLKQAVKRLMKETYELQLCHVHGITRPPDRLDQVLSEIVIDEGKVRCPSVYSDSIIQGNTNEAYKMEDLDRCVSDGDLRYISTHNSQMASPLSRNYDIVERMKNENEFKLEEVKPHSVPTSPQVKIKLENDITTNMMSKETKIPFENLPLSDDHLRTTTANKKSFIREASNTLHLIAGEKTKSLHRLVISKYQLENSVDTDEEMGSQENIPMAIYSNLNPPSNKLTDTSFTYEKGDMNSYPRSPKRVRNQSTRHQRTESSDSVGHINENASPLLRRNNKFLGTKTTN